MDPRPPPPVTIEGGPGWQLDRAARETGDQVVDDGPPARFRGVGRQAVALLLAGAVGFGAASLLAERRLSALRASPEGVLSLELGADGAGLDGELVTSSDGVLSSQTSVLLHNTGPRTIVLEDAELVGTGYRAEDLGERHVPADGRTTVQLLSPIRCDQPRQIGPPGPLRVRAATGAGSRTVELRMDASGLGFGVGLAAAACGEATAGSALVVNEPSSSLVDGRQARVPFELSNASASPIVLQELRLPAGLELAGLTNVDGDPVPLPLTLPPGDYDPPVEPFLGRGPARQLVAVVELTDCGPLRELPGDEGLFLPLFEAVVTDVKGRSGDQDATSGFGPGHTSWGDPAVLDRLRRAACGPSQAPLTLPSGAGRASR